MWDSQWLVAVMEIKPWVCQRKIKGKTVRERERERLFLYEIWTN